MDNAQVLNQAMIELARNVARETIAAAQGEAVAVNTQNPMAQILAWTQTPTPFTGELSESFADWMTEFEHFANRAGLNVTAKIEYLRMLLSGMARVAFDELKRSAQDEQANNWEYYKTGMKTRFPEERSAALREIAFFGRTQQPGETAEMFASSLKSLSRQAFPTSTQTERDRLTKSQFLRGLASDELRMHVVSTDLTDPKLEDYVRREMTRDIWAPGGPMSQTRHQTGATTTKLEQQIDALEQQVNTLSSALAELLHKSQTINREDRNYQHNQSQSRPRANFNDRPVGSACTYCRERGFKWNNHYDVDCGRKRQAEINLIIPNGRNNSNCHQCNDSGLFKGQQRPIRTCIPRSTNHTRPHDEDVLIATRRGTSPEIAHERELNHDQQRTRYKTQIYNNAPWHCGRCRMK